MKRNIGVKNILATFDQNCVIGYVAPVRNFKKENSMFMDYPPHKSEQGLNIWKRANLDIIFNTIFYEKKNIFDEGVWACQTKENTHFQINQLFGTLNYNLKSALFTKPPENYTGGLLPFPAKRDLKIIFDKFSEYNQKNTIVFTNYSNGTSDYRENEML